MAEVIEKKKDDAGKAISLKGANVYFKAGTTDEEIVKWDSEGATIHFDLKDFREIKDDVVAGLGNHTQKAYFKVLGAMEVLNLKPAHQVEAGTPFEIGLGTVHRLKEIPGFHVTLVRADEVDLFKDQGYLPVPNGIREERNGKVTLVEMMVNEANYRATLKANAEKPRKMLQSVKENFKDRVHEDKKVVRYREDES